MNHSIYSADRATHLKVVVSLLLACTAILVTALGARLAHPEVNAHAAATQSIYRPSLNHILTQSVRTGKHPT